MKKNKYKVKRVILHPGKVRSRYDGDIHFISARRLAELYNVLNTDVVMIDEHQFPSLRNRMSPEQFHNEGWIDLYPIREGDCYYDIHEHDWLDIDCKKTIQNFKKLDVNIIKMNKKAVATKKAVKKVAAKKAVAKKGKK